MTASDASEKRELLRAFANARRCGQQGTPVCVAVLHAGVITVSESLASNFAARRLTAALEELGYRRVPASVHACDLAFERSHRA